MYKHFFKRFFDFFISLVAIIVLSPVFIILIILGAIEMGGNPFFVQERPGWHEKIFKMIKFRTMTNKKDKDGNLLPDKQRLTGYGKLLRNTSLDELPELFNILVGDMAIVGPRPLLVKYLDRYNEKQHHRHDVRPGLTGYAQAHGRNSSTWEERFEMDLFYVNYLSFGLDIKIMIDTVLSILKREGIDSGESENVTKQEFMGEKK